MISFSIKVTGIPITGFHSIPYDRSFTRDHTNLNTQSVPDPLKTNRKTFTRTVRQDECAAADDEPKHMFIVSRKGGILLVHDNHIYRSNMRRQGLQKNILYWECVHNRSAKCRGRLKSEGNQLYISNTNAQHNHQSEMDRITCARVGGQLTYRTFASIFK